MSIVIQLTNISKKFRKHIIFQSLNLSVYKGEIISLFAPSGVGKTTLIKIMMGLMSPNSGSIQLFEQTPHRKLLKKIGYMEQGDALYEELNAKDHLIYFGQLYGLSGADLKRNIEAILNLVDLDSHNNKPIYQYSGGMKRRLSLAITLLHNPDLLILDEPTVGIDPELRKKFWSQFHELKQQGKTIIISTHLMDEIEQTDRVCMIGEKQILRYDTPENIKNISQCHNMEDAYIYFRDKAIRGQNGV